MRACADEFLAEVTECVVYGVTKVVTRPSFSLIPRHRASRGKWMFHHCVTRLHMSLGCLLKDRVVLPKEDYRGGYHM